MQVLIFGAGVIGRIYAARLIAAGHHVFLVARGDTRAQLEQTGIPLRRAGELSGTVFPHLIDTVQEAGEVDVALITIRRDQFHDAVPHLSGIDARVVVSLVNLPRHIYQLSKIVGACRFVAAFPGVAGRIEADGTVDYIHVAQQPTTVGKLTGPDRTSEPHRDAVARLLRSADFPVVTENNMSAWLQTHAVFITAFDSAIVARPSLVERVHESTRLGDQRVVRALILEVRAGFRALQATGVPITPATLRRIFLRLPLWLAVIYCIRELRGELGRLGLAPHAVAAQHTELPVLKADVRAFLMPPVAVSRPALQPVEAPAD